MGQERKSPQGTPGLREKAEARLQSRAPRWNELPLEEMRALVYELQVHQIELEMQNDALRQGQIAIEAANKKSSDFYDFAPMGFLTLDGTGMIREINLTAAGQLGVTRDRIIGKPLVSFIAEEDIDCVRACLRRVFQEPGPRHGEVKLKRPDGGTFLARLDSAASDVSGERLCLTSITDLSDLKQAEQNIQEREARFAAFKVPPPSNAMAVPEDITVSGQVQEAWRESEAEFRASFDQAPIGAAIASLDFHFQRVNNELCRLTGYSAAELTSRTFLDITHPEDQAESTKLGSLLARGEIKPYQMDKRYIRKNGEVIWVRLSVRLVKDAEGDPLYYLATMEDVTASKQAEEALKESESRYRLLVNQIPAVVFEGYADWRVDFLDRKVEELTGYDKEDFDSGRVKWCDVIHEDDFDYAQRVFIEALKTDKSYVREHRIRRKDGTIRWVQCRGQIFCDAEGKVDHISGVSFDITGRQEALSIIHQERQRFFSLLDMLPAFVALLVPDCTLPFVNRRFRETFGDPDGRLCHELIVSRPEPCEGCKALAVFETRQAIEYEWTSPQGKIYEIHDYPFDDIDGSPMVLELGIDITERKALEAQLLHSQKMEAVGRLAGGVAHDFNNLLMAIMGYGELIRSSLMADDPLYKYSDDILKATERAASLTQQLLAFSRQQVIRPQVLNPNRVAADLEKMLRRLIGEHIDLEIVADPALGPVKADPGQINQIIMNLAINARDAMPTGGRLILATANIDFTASHKCYSGVAPPGRYVKLAVSDTGSGMDAGTLNHLFEPFFTTKEMGKGTGLGLPMVYGIVKQNHGHVEVESQPGLGTTLSIYLPRLEVAAEAPGDRITLAEKLEGSETILVVEDEEALRTLLCRFFRLYGYNVIEARHGGEALLLCEQHPGPIHLMVTDVVMPQMSGKELAERLTPLHPEMTVFFMSGYTDSDLSAFGAPDSFQHIISKPFRPMDLVKKVRDALDASRGKPK